MLDKSGYSDSFMIVDKGSIWFAKNHWQLLSTFVLIHNSTWSLVVHHEPGATTVTAFIASLLQHFSIGRIAQKRLSSEHSGASQLNAGSENG